VSVAQYEYKCNVTAAAFQKGSMPSLREAGRRKETWQEAVNKAKIGRET
jgi:hypothetical protein